MRILTITCYLAFISVAQQLTAASPIDFDRDVLPILSDTCFACHGPDANQRQAELRMDLANDHLTTLLSPTRPATSEFIRRIVSQDDDQVMPPPSSKKILTDAQIEILTRWVKQGAKYDGHWAWEAPAKTELPRIRKKKWALNEIDYFVKSELDKHGLVPSSPASKLTLIRRVSLDLRGLPPTLAEVDQFLNDDSEHAYALMIQRMMDSVHYGERMAQDWLDLARYGDTNGYHADSDRAMWLYRDYVINAFNKNKPYNQFIIENVAGDLLPNANDETRIASGFNRNVTFNEEGGADPDEFYVAYAVDRANTTGQVFLGMTFGCAQCHDHKYDPISQREYYQFYAFFNSIQDEVGAGGPSGYHNKPLPPLLKIATADHKSKLEAAKKEHADAQRELDELTKSLKSDTTAFETATTKWLNNIERGTPPETLEDGLVLWLSADDVNGNRIPDDEEEFSAPEIIETWSDRTSNQLHAIATGKPALVKDSFNGRPAIKLNGVDDLLRTDTGAEKLANDFTIIATLKHDHLNGNQMMVMWGQEATGKRRSMWLVANSHMLAFNGHGADFIGNKPLVTDRPQIAVVTKQGTDHTIKTYVDGTASGEGKVSLNPYDIGDKNPITVGANNAGNEKTAALYAEVMIFDRVITDTEQAALTTYLATKYDVEATHKGLPDNIAAIIEINREQWNESQAKTVNDYFLNEVYLKQNKSLTDLSNKVAEKQKAVSDIDNSIPTTMVMVQKSEPNPAFVLMRGDFQNPGEEVTPDVPSIFPRLPADKPKDRLGLAYWLTDPEHPLVARVVVNRMWEQFFGTGLVKTLGDLGTQGERPSHPALLDWLAVEFIESGWNIKELQKTILTSATYMQSSVQNGAYEEIDPENRYLSRSPRFRLSAEEIRDNALAISGLLVRNLGGPSVKPYQPMGYYSDKIGRGWDQSKGDNLFRRGIYTYWRRTTVYPTFQIFDAPSREFCTVDRPRTNTPLQALVLLNDPTFVEAARVFAQKVLSEGGDTLDARLTFAFRSAVSRPPTAEEIGVLTEILSEQREVYKQTPEEAAKLVMAGESAKVDGLDPIDHAAWTALASIILNLDETITRE